MRGELAQQAKAMKETQSSMDKCVQLDEDQNTKLQRFNWAYGKCLRKLTLPELHELNDEFKKREGR